MHRNIAILSILAVFICAYPVSGNAFTLTIDDLSTDTAYFGKADVAPKYGGTATTEKEIAIIWSSTTNNGTWYVNIDSSTVNDNTHQVDNGTGSYSGGSMEFDLSASNIISHSDVQAADGRKSVYVLLYATDNDGGTAYKTQDTITPVYVYFKLNPPEGKPVISDLEAGDSNLKISMDWSSSSNTDDEGGFVVYYRPKGSTGPYQVTSEIKSTYYQLKGLDNLVEYEVVITQIDLARNESAPSAPAYGIPLPVADYYTYYKLGNGAEEGGFCFIATAAYGSPLHPFVNVLREFRDRYLMTNSPGRAFVRQYYLSSPRAAEIIRHNGFLSLASKIVLLPAVAFAWLFLHPAVPVLSIVFTFIAVAFIGRRKSRGSFGIKFLLFLLACSALVLTAIPANAGSPRNWALELKFGPYYPMQIDGEKGLQNKPYQEIFGYSYALMSQIQVDYILWQKFGSVSIGGGLGFWQARGKGMAYDPSTGEFWKSTDTTVFNMIPMTLVVSYRFDWFALKKGVPLVPFVKLGLDYYVWWILNGNGNVPSFDNGKGSGGKFGWHATAGLAFMLDCIDPGTANDLDLATGINHTYLIAEWTYSKVDNFNSRGFRLGSEYFLFGLLVEF